jgi:hypothetical protein
MNTVLVMLMCVGAQCNFEPLYAIVFPTEAACLEAAKQHSEWMVNKPHATCVPEIKIDKK